MSNVSTVIPAVAVSAILNVPVFPCKPNKKPYTGNGFQNATLDPYQINEWWEKHPDAFIGMPTGEVSGLVVVDVDQKNGKDGGASLVTLESEYERLPVTIETLTPTSGLHKFFLYPDKRIDTSSSRIGEGIDIRGDGGYVIIPPSKGYQWEISNPDRPAEMPEWLVDVVNEPKKKTRKKKSLISRIKRKDGLLKHIPPASNIKFPEGEYPAEFVGWQGTVSSKYILKKGQFRAILRFNVYAGGREYKINAYRTVNVLHDGSMSVGSSNQLAKDMSAIAGHYDDGFPIQLELDDLDMSIFRDKKLKVAVTNTTKTRDKVNGKWKFTKTTHQTCFIKSIVSI